MSKVDLHIHCNYSDGSDSVSELIENIKASNLEIFALTDHDTVAGACEIQKIVPENIKYIPSIELTCNMIDNVECHILGLNCDIECKELLALIEKGKVLRRNKLEIRIKYLEDAWNIVLTDEEKDWLYSRNSVVKTHIANILVKRGLAKENVAAMKKYLEGCKVPNSRFSAKEAIEAIVLAGGIPVWAHPLGGEGKRHLSEDVFFERLKIMQNLGIKGLECYYSRFNQKEIEFLKSVAEKENMLISGGSDYHGSNKENINLAKLNTDNAYVDSENLTVLKQLGY